MLRRIRIRAVLYALMVLSITVGIAAYVGYQVHTKTKETVLLRAELNTKEATIEYNRYLLTRVDIVAMVGNTVEDMLAAGAGTEKIEEYLTVETDNILDTLDPDTTGLYGWIGGAYVDGAGWVPEPGYVPTERPWYTQTLASDRDITLIDPYLDAQTGTVMMTVSKLLSDGESVLALDVSLAPVQRIIALFSDTTKGGQAFLLDGNGVVVAHSDESQLGRRYMDEPDSLGGVVARTLLTEGLRQFEIETEDGDYCVYTDALDGGWYSVSLINGDVWHRPQHRVMITFSCILALVLASIIVTFLRLTAQNIALQELHTKVVSEEKRGEALRALSETDRMTGLYDHVSGERKVSELLDGGSEGMFLELDIDHFKAINDNHGHQAGDQVIVAIADALRGTFRTNDVTMRLGGDEFGVFAQGIVERELGEAIVRRLFARLERVEIPALRGERVCVSVGAALCRREEKRSFRALYAQADDALYHSKKTDGNCLTFSA